MKYCSEHNILPAYFEQSQLLKKRSPRCTVVARTLYRRSFNYPLLMCVPHKYSTGQGTQKGMWWRRGARTLANKIILSGYYWPSFRKDATKYVKRCGKCQRFTNVPRLPSIP